MNLGNAIKRRRESARLSQLDLALQMGEGLANPSDISRIENGKQWPTKEKLEAIASVFGCPVAELFMDDDYELPTSRPAKNLGASERPSAYALGEADPSIDRALEVVEYELPAVDPKTQAILAVEIYKVSVSKQSADRIVSAINSLVMAVEQLRGES
jgi:transcriptional regulator with XRE-family HTH domain